MYVTKVNFIELHIKIKHVKFEHKILISTVGITRFSTRRLLKEFANNYWKRDRNSFYMADVCYQRKTRQSEAGTANVQWEITRDRLVVRLLRVVALLRGV